MTGTPLSATHLKSLSGGISLEGMNMKKSLRLAALSLVIGGGMTALGGVAFGDLVGGTYTTAPAASSWPGTPAYSTSLSGLSAQGFPGQDANADGTVLSEVVTPASNLTLGAITIDVAGISTFATGGMSLHIFSLASGQAFTGGSITGSGESNNNAVYNPYPGPDLLGGGSGLPFSSGGTSNNDFITFTLDNGTTNDNITLAGGTSYAIEFWNLSQSVPGTYSSTQMTWERSANQDLGGQMFAASDTLINPTASSAATGLRETISEEGLAGGAPRTGAIALYPATVPEPATLTLIGLGTAGLMLRRRKHA
jgi:hypothetical protein